MNILNKIIIAIQQSFDVDISIAVCPQPCQSFVSPCKSIQVPLYSIRIMALWLYNVECMRGAVGCPLVC